MKTTLSPVATILVTLVISTNAVAQGRLPAVPLCLTFGQSTDMFAGETTPRRSTGGYYSLSMLEQTYARAAYGSLVYQNGRYQIGMSKNTNTATVNYQCDIGGDSLNGQCSLMVFYASTPDATLMNDVGYLEFGTCAASAAARGATQSAYPAGEGG